MTTDSMFLKVMALSNELLGDVQIGASYQFIQTDLQGARHIRMAFQSPQNAYLALHFPYILKRLARSNNFIEDLIVEYSSSSVDSNRRTYSPIISNSRLSLFRI